MERAWRAGHGQLNRIRIPAIIISEARPRSMEPIKIRIGSEGMTMIESQINMMTRSTAPPTKPENRPISTPITVAATATTTPTTIEL